MSENIKAFNLYGPTNDCSLIDYLLLLHVSPVRSEIGQENVQIPNTLELVTGLSSEMGSHLTGRSAFKGNKHSFERGNTFTEGSGNGDGRTHNS